MKKTYFNFIILLVFALTLSIKAQDNSKEKFRKSGLMNITEFGIVREITLDKHSGLDSYTAYNNTENNMMIYSINTINGYNFNFEKKSLFLGVGVGFDRWTQASMLPIYLDVRGYLNFSKLSPFLYTDFGYSIGWLTKNNSSITEGKDWAGIMMGIGGGISYYPFTKNNIGFSLSFGYKSQQKKIQQFLFNYPSLGKVSTGEDEHIFSNMLVLKLGVSF